MEYKKIRIPTNLDGTDKVLTVDLKQSFDILEILSLKINRSEFYKKFSSDYGVLIGRVNVNGGYGVPNAKVSIFIPITDEDLDNEVISTIYPYTTVNSTNYNGVRYNLFTPKEDYPLGTFPSKREVLDSDVVCEVYEKYYKYTTVTNESGDYMIFGVPTGQQTVHMDIDLSDIGKRSFKANTFVANGYPEALLKNNTDNKLTFQASNNLGTLPQIISEDVTIDIHPLWGDSNVDEIGITRLDFNNNLEVHNYSTLVFNLAFDVIKDFEFREGGFWNWKKDVEDLGVYNSYSDFNGMTSEFRPGQYGNVTPVPTNITDGTTFELPTVQLYKKNPNNDLVKVGGAEILSLDVNNSGLLVVKILCDDDRYLTDEYGNLIKSNNNLGIATTGSYVVDIMGNFIAKSGYTEFYNYRLTPNNELFKFDVDKIYTVKWQQKEHFGRWYGLRGRMGSYYDSETNQNFSNIEYQRNDWNNGLLYFGRMGSGTNNDDIPRQARLGISIPTNLRKFVEENNEPYYNINVGIVEITDIMEGIFLVIGNTVTKNTHPDWIIESDYKFGVLQPKSNGNITLNNLIVFITALPNKNDNNYKRFKDYII